jgi:hypothetical protein
MQTTHLHHQSPTTQYVDLEYEGGGIGEYSYWDMDRKSWDRTTCDYTGSSRCAKMDCHLDNTHWSLLGFFKHRNYDDWMEQLFKHEVRTFQCRAVLSLDLSIFLGN